MSQRIVWAGVLGLALILGSGAGWGIGADKGGKNPASDMPALVKPAEPDAIQPLGKTVELIFRIKDGDLPALSINCASDRYAIQTQFEGAKGYANIDISGRLFVRDNGRLLVTYQALIDFEGNDGSVHASSMGSTEVLPGGEARMMTIAGKSLMVQVKPVADAPVAAQ